MTALETIERHCSQLAAARAEAQDILLELAAAVRELRRQYRLRITSRLNAVARIHNQLVELVQSSPSLFERPRTQIIAGIRVGFRKGKGGITWDDDDQVIRLIRKHLTDQADVLIRTTERPLKNAIAALDVGDLRRIGARVEETGDVVVVQPTDTEIDILVSAFLREREEAPEQPETEPAVIAGR